MSLLNNFPNRRHAGEAKSGHDGKMGDKLLYDIGSRGFYRFQGISGDPLVENWDKLPGLNAALALANASGGAGPTAAEFLSYTALNKSFEILGTGTPRTRFTGNGIELSCTNTDGDSVILAPHLDVGTILSVSQPVTRWSCGRWKSQNRVRFMSRIRTAKIGDISNAARSTTTVSITTSLPHNLAIGQSVTINVATGPTDAERSAINGTFVVVALTSTTVFTYTTTTSGTISSVASTGTATPNNLKLQTIWTGLKKTNTATIATDDDQFYIRYLDSEYGGAMQVVTSRAGTDIVTALPIFPVPNTVYNILFHIDENRIPSVWVNGQYFDLKCGQCQETGADGSAALTSGVSLIPYTGTSTNGTTPGTKALDVLSGYSIDALDLLAAA